MRKALPQTLATLPPSFKAEPLFDQSVFVRGARWAPLAHPSLRR
jgi:hypothetical protein